VETLLIQASPLAVWIAFRSPRNPHPVTVRPKCEAREESKVTLCIYETSHNVGSEPTLFPDYCFLAFGREGTPAGAGVPLTVSLEY